MGAKTGRWDNLEHFLFGLIATVILYKNHGNTSIELILDVGCSSASSSSLCTPWRHALFATSDLLNLHANSSKQYHLQAYLTSVDANLMCRGPLSQVKSRLLN